MVLRFEEIDTKNGKSPIIASVAGVAGEKDVKARVGKEVKSAAPEVEVSRPQSEVR
jgi:hypothetical protein